MTGAAMYLDHYGLAEAPFSITPDPRFVFLSERHRDALAHLHFGITQGGGGGFVQLTGEVGTGKTTLCRLLLEQLPDTVRVALVLNPMLSPLELLETIAEELRLDLDGARGNHKALLDRLNRFLLDAYAQGLQVVVIIDEAQNLSTEALEQVRLLTNLETPTQKLLQMILLGQPELRDLLERPNLRQLAQRITARYHLTPLDAGEVEQYVRHRFAVAGGAALPFSKLALQRLAKHSGGVPRLINVIAERALLAGYARDEKLVGERLLDVAAAEILGTRRRRLPRPTVGFGAAMVLLVVLGLFALRAPQAPTNTPTAEADTPAPLRPPMLDASALDQRLQAAGDARPVWRELLRLWAVRSQEASADSAMRCPTVLAPGLFCLSSRGSLDALAQIGRPALVRLRHRAGSTDVLLLGVDGRTVRLWMDGIAIEVARPVFDARFDGRYVALWRGPTFLDHPPQRGDTGPAADWLQAQLAARMPGLPADGPALIGPAHVQAIRDLQAQAGLRVDGIVGPETLLLLGADASDGPRLRQVLE